jgi:hypothetical protein
MRDDEPLTSQTPDLLDVGCRATFLLTDGRRLHGTLCIVNFAELEQDGTTLPRFGFRCRDGVYPLRDCRAWELLDRDTRPAGL